MAITRKFLGNIGRTVADTEFRFEGKESPSKGKPNVIYILLDDLGFAQLGCYGSTINTPNIDRLATEGLRYNNFHTTAICSATRASLLTGINHHSCGINTTSEGRTGLNNALGGINPSCATLAEILREYDYRTMAVGKWHLCGQNERTDSGPYHNWPLAKGFDTYYGFLAAHMDQWNPTLTRDNTMVSKPHDASETYHLSEDFTDNAIRYIYNHRFSYPDQPFFLYLAYGAMHSPHHAPKQYVEKYRGKFDKGWDKIREEWFENQKRLGIVDDTAELTDRNEYVSAWEDLTGDQKKAYARYMEVFAGYLEHTDAQIGRLIEFLDKNDILDDTIIVFTSDNGASAEGGKDGHFNQNTSMDVVENYPRDVERILEHYDTVGDEYSLPHYPTGWANAGNTPFPWYKAWVYEGGVKDPLIIRYPKMIKDKGGIRRQFNHVIDITPTVLDMLALEKPESIRGIAQKPLEGISFAETFENASAYTGKRIQYFEMYGNRGIYKDGWKAVTNHEFNEDYKADVWELYHVDEDYSEKYNVADRYPEKVKELEEEWFIQAAKYGVFPMPLHGFHGAKDQLEHMGVGAVLPASRHVFKHVDYPYVLPANAGISSLVGGNHTVKITVNRKDTEEKGVLIAHGDRFGGISIYIKNNRLHYVYNYDGDEYYVAVSDKELPLGKNELAVQFKRLDDGRAEASMDINGEWAGSTVIEKKLYMTVGETTLKVNKPTSVYEKDYMAPFEYTGEIEQIVIDVEETLVDPRKELQKNLHVD